MASASDTSTSGLGMQYRFEWWRTGVSLSFKALSKGLGSGAPKEWVERFCQWDMVAEKEERKSWMAGHKSGHFMLLFNWIRGMPWYFPKKIQGKDHWESLLHRKAYWMFNFNIVRTYLEIMEMMMSCVLNIGTITITNNWFGKWKRHTRQMAIFRRHINKNPKYKGESSSDRDLVMTEDGQYYSEGEMIWSVTIHS